MTPVPGFQIEEHHEAFLIWQYAIHRGLIAPVGNRLLHIDEHADLGLPRLSRSLESLGNDLRDIAEFTYAELNIGNFILPAAYLGIVNELYWVRHGHASETRRRNLSVRAANGPELSLRYGLMTMDQAGCNISGLPPMVFSVVHGK